MIRKYKVSIFLATCILLFIGIRSYFFAETLNFSHDQGFFSLEAIELWRNKALVLIGPSTSFIWNGHAFYQGSVIYYMLLIFLLLGRFDPIQASYCFMLFSSAMIIPLFFGIRNLISEKAAYLVSCIYTLFPLYIIHTKFLWNPNFQFSLLPLLLFCMGMFAKTKKTKWLFVIGTVLGILLLFHYQFLLIMLGVLLYFSLFKKIGYRRFGMLFAGVILGFSPILLFELRNNFYNLQTIFLILGHFSEVSQGSSSFALHYVLSLSFMLLVLVVGLSHKFITDRILWGIFVVLFVSALLFTQSTVQNANTRDWNYLVEQRAHEIILAQGLSDYNVVNLVNDTNADVQKYLLAKENISLNTSNYTTQRYLFILVDIDQDYMTNPAYEVNTFLPSEVVNKWDLNDKYKLILRERLTEEEKELK